MDIELVYLSAAFAFCKPIELEVVELLSNGSNGDRVRVKMNGSFMRTSLVSGLTQVSR